MATGPEILESIIHSSTSRRERWIDVFQKIDLCKLTAADLLAQGIESHRANEVAAALNRRDVGPLGEAFNLSLRVKFKAWAERSELACKIMVEQVANANWLRSYFASKLHESQISSPVHAANKRFVEFTIRCSANIHPWMVQRALIDCPAIILMRNFPVSVSERPHYLMQAYNLAAWIDDQGAETWWSVDGDPWLTSRLDFPCPAEELSQELRSIDKLLFVADPRETATGEAEITPEDERHFVDLDEFGKRRLYLSWQDGPSDWLLIEDEALVGT